MLQKLHLQKLSFWGDVTFKYTGNTFFLVMYFDMISNHNSQICLNVLQNKEMFAHIIQEVTAISAKRILKVVLHIMIPPLTFFATKC